MVSNKDNNTMKIVLTQLTCLLIIAPTYHHSLHIPITHPAPHLSLRHDWVAPSLSASLSLSFSPSPSLYLFVNPEPIKITFHVIITLSLRGL